MYRKSEVFGVQKKKKKKESEDNGSMNSDARLDIPGRTWIRHRMFLKTYPYQ